jgi:hypothetical protein
VWWKDFRGVNVAVQSGFSANNDAGFCGGDHVLELSLLSWAFYRLAVNIQYS